MSDALWEAWKRGAVTQLRYVPGNHLPWSCVQFDHIYYARSYHELLAHYERRPAPTLTLPNEPPAEEPQSDEVPTITLPYQPPTKETETPNMTLDNLRIILDQAKRDMVIHNYLLFGGNVDVISYNTIQRFGTNYNDAAKYISELYQSCGKQPPLTLLIWAMNNLECATGTNDNDIKPIDEQINLVPYICCENTTVDCDCGEELQVDETTNHDEGVTILVRPHACREYSHTAVRRVCDKLAEMLNEHFDATGD